jgi:hypothetical protein
MKSLRTACLLLTAICVHTLQAQESPSPSAPSASPSLASPLMPGMKGSYETLEGTVEKVYSAEHDGFKYRSYVVKWKDQDVVIADMMALSDKQVGDKLTYMAQEIEIPAGTATRKMLQFIIMDMKGLQKLGAEMLKTTGTTTPAASPGSSPAAP